MLQENIKKIKECRNKEELKKLSESFKSLEENEKIKLRGYYIWKINELSNYAKVGLNNRS